MFDSIKQYIRREAREATLYACLTTTAFASGGCAALDDFGKDYVNFHKRPIETIINEPQKAILPIVIDGLIIYGISEATRNGGGGGDGGGEARTNPKGPPF